MVVASTALACHQLVPVSGLVGAAVAMVVGAVVRLALSAAVVAYLFLAHATRVEGHQVPKTRIDEWGPSL